MISSNYFYLISHFFAHSYIVSSVFACVCIDAFLRESFCFPVQLEHIKANIMKKRCLQLYLGAAQRKFL